MFASSFIAGIAYFLIVFATGFLFGIIRTIFVELYIGEIWAVLVEIPIILTLSWFISVVVVRRTGVPAKLLDRLVMGTVAFTCLVSGEIAISVGLRGITIIQHFQLYENMPALFGLVGQIIFGLIPTIQIRVGASDI